MGGMILQLEQITKSFGGRTLFANATLRLEAYDHLALVGPNGAGKTTLLRIITGQEDADSGRVVLAKDATIGYLEQEAIEMGENPIFSSASWAPTPPRRSWRQPGAHATTTRYWAATPSSRRCARSCLASASRRPTCSA